MQHDSQSRIRKPQPKPGENGLSRSAGHARPRETLTDRLREAGLKAERFVDLQDGTKASYTDHRLAQNQSDVESLEGEYGVMAGDGLVFLDVDSYRSGIEGVPKPVKALPDTFTVETPHGGEHRYYAVEGDVSNIKADWGEVRAEDQYVVGPGSQLDDCNKDWHDCTKSDKGQYKILHDNPIARIHLDELQHHLDLNDDADDILETERGGDSGLEDVPLSEPEDSPDELVFTDIEADFDVQTRWEKLLRSEHGEEIKDIWDGRYRDAGYVADDGTGDRSDAEFVLLEHLGWWMNDEKDVVAEMMNRICSEIPQTDGGRRKWLERDDEYSKDRLDLACDHTRTYERATDWPTLYGEDRPPAGGPIQERVLDVLMKLGIASTAELIEHDRVDRSRRQVRRALDQLEENELVDSIKDPEDRRRVLYYSTVYESKLPKLLEDRS